MRKRPAAALCATLFVGLVLVLSPSWREALGSDPWWHNLLRAGTRWGVMFLGFLGLAHLPEWAKRRTQKPEEKP
jgi:hypothetical protein